MKGETFTNEVSTETDTDGKHFKHFYDKSVLQRIWNNSVTIMTIFHNIIYYEKI